MGPPGDLEDEGAGKGAGIPAVTSTSGLSCTDSSVLHPPPQTEAGCISGSFLLLPTGRGGFNRGPKVTVIERGVPAPCMNCP